MKHIFKKLMPLAVALSMILSSAGPFAVMPVYASEEPSVYSDNADMENVGQKVEEAEVAEKSTQETVSDPTQETAESTDSTDGEQSVPALTSDTADRDLYDETNNESVRFVVRINEQDYEVKEGESMTDAAQAAVDSVLSDITSVDFVSGNVTADELKFFSTNASKLTGLKSLKLNIGDGLTFVKDGQASTVFPSSTFNFTSTTYLKSLTDIELKGFTQLGDYSLKMKNLVNIKIPDVKEIGVSTFDGDSKLVSVEMGTLEKIGNKAFSGTGLMSITINGKPQMGASVFAKCTSLTTAEFPDMEDVPEKLFEDCTKLTTVNIPNMKTVAMFAFSGCRAANIDVNQISKITSIGSSAFQDCTAIKGELDLTAVSSVVDNAFSGCTGITSANLSGWTSIPNKFFERCTKLASVTMDDVTSIGTGAFKNCSSLTTINLPEIKELSEECFYSCKGLKEIKLPLVETIGSDAFYACSSLTKIELPEVKNLESGCFRNCTNLKEIVIPKIESIGSNAFASIKQIVNVTIDKKTPPTISSSAFSSVADGSVLTVPEGSLENYLTSVVIGNIYTSTSQIYWNRLKIEDPEYIYITYKDPASSNWTRYQVLGKDMSVGEAPFAMTKNGYQLSGLYTDSNCTEPKGGIDESYTPKTSATIYQKWEKIKVSIADKDGEVVDTFDLRTDTYNQLKDQYPELPEGAIQWNTKPDGSGDTILADTKIYHDITLYPIYDNIINVSIKINDGEEIGSANLGTAVKNSGVETVTKLEVVSGKLTYDDYKWMDDGIMDSVETLIIHEGVESENKTVPAGTATSAPNLKYLEIHGVEVLESAAIIASQLETVILPDVKSMGSNSLGANTSRDTFITRLEIPSIEVLGSMSFAYQTSLPSMELVWPNLKSIGDNCFKGAGAIRIITNQVPEISETHAMDPGSVIVVPENVYDTYVEEHGSDEIVSGVKLEKAAPEVVITIKVGDATVGGTSLEDAIENSGITIEELKNLEIVSGTITQDDLAYLSELSYLESFKMNLSSELVLKGLDGKDTTVLSPETAVLKFADPREGSSKSSIQTVTLGGITEICYGGLKASSVEEVYAPDVVTVGERAFIGLKWLEKVDLTNAVTVGEFAFSSCERLVNIKMDKVEVLKEGSFQYTNSLKQMTLPYTIKTIEDIKFGIVTNGNKSGTKIVINAITPPEVNNNAFKGVSSVTTEATLTVPAAAFKDYVHQNNPNADVSGILKINDILWKNLYLRAAGSYVISYEVPQKNWLKQYAFVPAGSALQGSQIAVVDKDEAPENTVFAGWNEKKDGTGNFITEGYQPDKDTRVYAQWQEIVVEAKINDVEYGGLSLQDILESNDLDAEDVESLEFVSGKITADDLAYMKDHMKYNLQTLKMNLNDNLSFVDEDGMASTTIPDRSLQGMALVNVEIAGFTEIEGLAFQSCKKLTNVSMPDMVSIGKDAFYWTDSYIEINLPASIKTLDDCGFDRKSYGSGKNIHVTMNSEMPPANVSGPFSHAGSEAYVTVPAGSLPNYLSDLDLNGVHYMSGSILWANLHVIDPEYHYISYFADYVGSDGRTYTNKQFAYVHDGDSLTENRISKGPFGGNEGKELVGWNTEKDGSGIMIDADTVPTEDMVVYAIWKDIPAMDFDDVSENDWYYDYVKDVYEKGLMTGLNDTTFGPGENLARAQFAVILYRMNGEPEVEYNDAFYDVPENEWYTKAVLWANQIGVVTGYSNGNFGPADNITREQMALMMYRYADYLGYDTSERADLSSFSDASFISDYALEAMQWANAKGIITGKSDGRLDPNGYAVRAECATIILRFDENF